MLEASKLTNKPLVSSKKIRRKTQPILLQQLCTKNLMDNNINDKIREFSISTIIFLQDKPPLKALVDYLVSEGFSISEISKITKRSYTTIWLTYKKKNKTRRNKKKSGKKRVLNNNILLPISIFNDQLSILESIVKYLKEVLNLRYYEIANLLGRDNRTIWTIYKRVKEKERRK